MGTADYYSDGLRSQQESLKFLRNFLHFLFENIRNTQEKNEKHKDDNLLLIALNPQYIFKSRNN